jgi:SAM-dependent methyltransferase
LADYDHNAHYRPLVLRALPEHAADALDVGCGDGDLARTVARRTGAEVLGIDADPQVVATARAMTDDPSVRFVAMDFASFETERRFDVVCAVASIHHMTFAPALDRMVRLLRPGGVLVVLGCYREEGLVDVAAAGIAVPVSFFHALGSPSRPSIAPIRPPEMTLGEIRTAARRRLPDSRLRRLLLWRYLLTWTAPRRTAQE